MTVRKPRTPSLRHHKPTDQAFVELSGHRFYLGRWGTPAAEKAYHRRVAEWVADGRTLKPAVEEATIAELGAAYLAHAEAYYVRPDGTPTSEIERVRRAVDGVLAIYGEMPAAQFGPKCFRVVRSTWIADGLSRNYINSLAGCVRRWFRWCAGHELCAVTVPQALAAVEPLKRGRCQARETEAVKPAILDHVEATKPYLSRVLRAMVDFQRHTGCRPGEACALRRRDIDATGPVWIARPEQHKGAWRGRTREIYIGPQAQEVLRPYLLRPADAYLFDPRDAIRERTLDAHTPRRPNQVPTPRATDRTVQGFYTGVSYARAIERAVGKCNEARAKQGEPPIEPWSPNRLRHLAATEIRKKYGIEAAQLILGHAHASTTEIYAETDRGKALEIAKAIG